MRVIALQYDIAWENQAANFDKVRQLLHRASPCPGALVVLPEMFATGFSMRVELVAEPESGPTEQFLSELARTLQCTIVGGKVSPGKDGKGRNEAVVFNDRGGLVARYAKQRTFNPGGEGQHYECGVHHAVVATGAWRWVPLVCYDLRFPELFRRAVREDVQLFVVIANWPLERLEHWHILLRARAIENQAFVVGVNRCGQSPQLAYGGGSLVVGPRGEVLAQAGDRETVLDLQLDLETLLAYRRNFPVLADMQGGQAG
ncbi:MAG: carbon-nitrogen family hydrolase [Verrucomicrobiae bacterium]|nr:carbon-nitrogen family hydrolase [Verrucomicrobiae bacterium]